MMKMLSYILLCFALTGCFGEETDIKLIGTEGWTDLMPGTPGQTYVHITLQAAGKEAENAEVTGVNFSWNEENYTLKQTEYNYKITPHKDNVYELFLRTVFLAKKKDLQEIDAEIEITIGKEKISYKIPDIKIDKVY